MSRLTPAQAVMLQRLGDVESLSDVAIDTRQVRTINALIKRGLVISRWNPPPLGQDSGGGFRYYITQRGRTLEGHSRNEYLLDVINKAAWHLENDRPSKALNELQKALRAQR